MITCPSCAKQNQDHYRFCLGCGAELPQGAAEEPVEQAPDIADEETKVGGTVSQPPASQPPLEEPVDAGLPPGMCPECEFVNPPTNRFCASCGFRLDQPAAQKPKPKPVDTTSDGSGAILVGLDPEGNEIGRHELARGESNIGRDSGTLFAGDAFLSPQHAVFAAEGGKVRVRDNESLNGVFRKLLAEQREPLQSGQKFRVGQELLLFEQLDPEGPDDDGTEALGGDAGAVVGRLSLVIGRQTATPSVPIYTHGLNIGRERGDILFPEDGYVSGLHCHVSCEDGAMYVTDLGSSNGTFVQLLGETELRNGDVLLMGQQLFRVTI